MMTVAKSRILHVVDAIGRDIYKIDGCYVVLQVELQKNGFATVLAPNEFRDHMPTIAQVSIETSWLECDGPARLISSDQLKDFAWKVFVDHVFILAGLSEMDTSSCSSAVLSNKEIAEKFRNRPEELYNLALQARKLEFAQTKRRFMSINALQESKEN